MRIELIAFFCTVALFVLFGLFLVVDFGKVELRSVATGRITESAPTAPAAVTAELKAPVQPPSRAQPAAPKQSAGSQATAAAGTPPAPADAQKAALNNILKAAAVGDWLRVDELLLISSSASGGSSAPEARELAQRGKQAIAAMDYGAAIEALSSAVAANPEDAEAFNNLAFALLRQGKSDEAHAQVTRSLALEPVRAATWANAAEILAERDNALAAQAALRVAIHLSHDRKRTVGFLNQAGEKVESEKFRAVIAEILPELPKIPSVRRSPA